MSETLSERTAYHVEYQISTWLRRFERELREIEPLSNAETETLLRFIYGDEGYQHAQKLKEIDYLTPSVYGKELRLCWASPLNGQGHITVIVRAYYDLPAMFGHNNALFISNNLESLAQVYGGLPERFQLALQNLNRVQKAVTELKARIQEYTRSRWLLAQWPSAMAFFPEHTKTSLKARPFKRPPPKKVTPLTEETLQTLAWLSLIYPISETHTP